MERPTFIPNSAPMPMKIRLGSRLRVSFDRLTLPMESGRLNWGGIQASPSRSDETTTPATPARPSALAFFTASPPCEYIALSVSPVGMLAGNRRLSTEIIWRLRGIAMKRPRYRIRPISRVSCHQTNV